MLLPLLLFFHFYFWWEFSLLSGVMSTWRTFFGISCGADVLVIWSVSFLLSGNYVTFLYFMDIFQFSRSVVSDCLRPHESQHARSPCPSSTPRVHSDSRPSSQWCHPAISSSVVPFSSAPIPPSIRAFSNESTLCMRWPKYWSFSFSIIPSKEYPGLISFRMDWLDLLAVQGTLKSLLQHHSQFKSINSSALSLLHSPTLTSIHDHRKNHSLD